LLIIFLFHVLKQILSVHCAYCPDIADFFLLCPLPYIMYHIRQNAHGYNRLMLSTYRYIMVKCTFMFVHFLDYSQIRLNRIPAMYIIYIVSKTQHTVYVRPLNHNDSNRIFVCVMHWKYPVITFECQMYPKYMFIDCNII